MTFICEFVASKSIKLTFSPSCSSFRTCITSLRSFCNRLNESVSLYLAILFFRSPMYTSDIAIEFVIALLTGVLKKLFMPASKNIRADIKIDNEGTIDVVKNNPNICLLKRLFVRLLVLQMRYIKANIIVVKHITSAYISKNVRMLLPFLKKSNQMIKKKRLPAIQLIKRNLRVIKE